ncbi:hypothetical protein G7054_g10483 [Neopestalotiopsis clavispora]|nr:hypothetical protein G7054_g10483 [Neopestalotiopsis clavispora]
MSLHLRFLHAGLTNWREYLDSFAHMFKLLISNILTFHSQELHLNNSFKLAQLAQADAAGRKEMAVLADLTFRDSRAMRIATAIAMIYLPINLVMNANPQRSLGRERCCCGACHHHDVLVLVVELERAPEAGWVIIKMRAPRHAIEVSSVSTFLPALPKNPTGLLCWNGEGRVEKHDPRSSNVTPNRCQSEPGKQQSNRNR